MRDRRAPGDDVKAAEAQAKACDLRAAGHTYREIALELRVSPSTAERLVERGLAALVAEPAARARAVELRHLERMRRGLAGAGALEGDPKAVMAAVRVSERIARLRGLDAPSRVEASVTKSLQDMTDAELLAAMAACNGGNPP